MGKSVHSKKRITPIHEAYSPHRGLRLAIDAALAVVAERTGNAGVLGTEAKAFLSCMEHPPSKKHEVVKGNNEIHQHQHNEQLGIG